MYIFIYSNHNINLRSSIANRIFLTMLLIATIVCVYRIIYMFFYMHHFKHRVNCANERRVVHVDSLSLSLSMNDAPM